MALFRYALICILLAPATAFAQGAFAQAPPAPPAPSHAPPARSEPQPEPRQSLPTPPRSGCERTPAPVS